MKVKAETSATVDRHATTSYPSAAPPARARHPLSRRPRRAPALAALVSTLLAAPALVSTHLAALALTLLAAPALEAQEAERPWNASSELSFVRTGGNAESSTLGLAGTVTHSWDRTEVKVEAGGIRTRSTRVHRAAIGSESDYTIDETSERSLSAENYHGLVRVDRRFSTRTAVYVQSGWKRNTFAGFKHRVVNVLGVSTRWVRESRQRFRTAYGLTHTVQRDVVPDPEASSRFVGLRLSSEYFRQMTENTDVRSNLVLDGNADDPSDLRADWTNSVSVAMNEHLGLKTSFRTTFDNEPALRRVPLRSPQGEKAGTVLVPRSQLDRVFTIALVVTF